MREWLVFVRKIRWPAAVAVVLALSIAVTMWGSASAPRLAHEELAHGDFTNREVRLPRARMDIRPMRWIAHQAIIAEGSQFYNDLTVVSGQTIDDDVVVLSGNVRVEPEGTIAGNLVVYSGNVEVQEEGEIEGDLTAFSGNVTIAGTVEGNVSSWSGNVVLLPTAVVEGDVSAVSGSIQRERGAEVNGNVITGPRFGGPSRAPDAPDRPSPFDGRFGAPFNGDIGPQRNGAVSAVEWLWRFILRLIGAGIITALIAGLAWLLTTMRPQSIEAVKSTIRRETALSFVVGIVVNLALVFVTGIFTVTVCLIPLALLSMLAILALNLAGWTALGSLVSDNLGRRTDRNLSPAWASALGVALITAAAAVLWAFGGCFRFVGSVALLIVASVGTGAFLLPWIRRHNIGGTAFAPTGTPPDTPPDEGPTPGASADTTTRASSVDVYTAQPSAPETGSAPDATTVPLSAEELDTAELSTEELGIEELGIEDLNTEDLSTEDVGEESGESPLPDSSTSAPIVPIDETPYAETSLVPHEDDFTQLYGVGPATDRKLKDANIRTFADLANLTVNEVAGIVGFPPERVARIELIEQARAKAEGQ